MSRQATKEDRSSGQRFSERWVDERSEKLLGFNSIAARAFGELEEKFSSPHAAYLEWMEKTIAETLGEKNDRLNPKSSFPEALENFGIDWLTLHYKTRHPAEEWMAGPTEWLQVGVPIARYMKKKEFVSLLSTTYRTEQSPYISSFSKTLSEVGEPIRIFLGDETINPGWLCVSQRLTEFIRDRTEGATSQGTEGLSLLARYGEDDPKLLADLSASGISFDEVNLVRKTVSQWLEPSGENGEILSVGGALGELRNACRVTLLALLAAREDIFLPRVVVLVPVAVQANVVGGIAFVGTERMSRFESKLLGLITSSLLTGLRLREEHLLEKRIQQAEGLSSARAFFVQSMGHSIHSPLDALHSLVKETVEWIKGVEEGAQKALKSLEVTGSVVQRARDSAIELIATFAKKDAQDYIRVKKTRISLYEFFDTLQFLHSRVFDKYNVSLSCSAPPYGNIPKNWELVVDDRGFLEVFNNLLSNSIRFAATAVYIEIKRSEGEDGYEIHVHDDGRGVDDNVAENLFKPAVHGESHYKDRGENDGAGFGLFLSKLIIDRHDGSMSYTKSRFGGAEFVIQLPVGEDVVED